MADENNKLAPIVKWRHIKGPVFGTKLFDPTPTRILLRAKTRRRSSLQV
jgi:hypothetical protein